MYSDLPIILAISLIKGKRLGYLVYGTINFVVLSKREALSMQLVLATRVQEEHLPDKSIDTKSSLSLYQSNQYLSFV